MLDIKNLSVTASQKPILKNLNLSVKKGQTAIIFGPNGCGKTTLFNTIAGFSKYKINRGEIIFNSKKINKLSINARHKLGISIMLQHSPQIKGLKYNQISKIKNSYSNREIGIGMSGGEIKLAEIQQLKNDPTAKFYLIDEPDSGVDIENLKIISERINNLLSQKDKSALIITHSGAILNYLNADIAYVLLDGKIKCSGIPKNIFGQIKKYGYRNCQSCSRI